MDLRCKTATCRSKKLGEAEAPSHVEIKCPLCKELNIFILTNKEENVTTAEPQSFIENYEKTASSINRSI